MCFPEGYHRLQFGDLILHFLLFCILLPTGKVAIEPV